jgi:hypothetical protein
VGVSDSRAYAGSAQNIENENVHGGSNIGFEQENSKTFDEADPENAKDFNKAYRKVSRKCAT